MGYCTRSGVWPAWHKPPRVERTVKSCSQGYCAMITMVTHSILPETAVSHLKCNCTMYIPTTKARKWTMNSVSELHVCLYTNVVAIHALARWLSASHSCVYMYLLQGKYNHCCLCLYMSHSFQICTRGVAVRSNASSSYQEVAHTKENKHLLWRWYVACL